MYLIADIIYLAAYYLVGYRLRVVRDNIAACFPEYSLKERRRLERRYYRHMADLCVEFVYNLFATPPALKRRYRIVNRQLVDRYYEQGRTVVLMSGHQGNWEYMVTTLGMQLLHHGIGVGMPLHSRLFGDFVAKKRVRYGTQVVYRDTVRQEVEYYDEHHVPCALMLLSDQSPTNPHRSYWTTFLGRDTAFLYGAEHFARQYNYPVLYYNVAKVRRGYYEVTFSTLCDNPSDAGQYSIVEAYVRRLEADIRRHPEQWLWSHRRWKLTREGRILKDGTLKIIPK